MSSQSSTQKVVYCTILFLILTSSFAIAQIPKGKFEWEEEVEIAGTEPTIPDTTKIFLMGMGDLQNSLGSGDGFQANTGLGIRFNRFWPGNLDKKKKFFREIEFDLYVNVASTADSIFIDQNNGAISNRRSLGNYLLVPMNSGQAAVFNLKGFFIEPNNPNLINWRKLVNGFYGQVIASNSRWVIDDKSYNVTGGSFKIGFFHEFVPMWIRRTEDVSIQVGLSYSMRGVFGDLATPTESINRMELLGTEQTIFHGVEANIEFIVKSVKVQVAIPFIFAKPESNIPGLTNMQFVTALKFIADVPVGKKT
ncbi:MAG: hypothetical protein IPI60_05460 [Saprospiraceae bacterium]|nr:hypothetical protein [Saprospiraceae bacterium]